MQQELQYVMKESITSTNFGPEILTTHRLSSPTMGDGKQEKCHIFLKLVTYKKSK